MSQIEETEPLLFTESKTYTFKPHHVLLPTLISIIVLFFISGLTLMFIITTSVIFGFISVTIWVCGTVRSYEELIFPEESLLDENVFVLVEDNVLDITLNTKGKQNIEFDQIQGAEHHDHPKGFVANNLELYSGEYCQEVENIDQLKSQYEDRVIRTTLVDREKGFGVVPTKETRVPLFDAESKGDEDFD
jgi:hypothetical protein